MIDVKKAAMNAAGYFVDLYADQKYSDILLEEVEYDEDDNVWHITLGYSPPLTLLESAQDPLSPLSPLSAFSSKERQYKIFTMDAETGKVISMKIRTVEHA